MRLILELVRGDDASFEFVLPSADPAILTFTAKRKLADPDADAVLRYALGDGIEVTDTSATVTVPASDTADLDAPLILVWDLEAIDGDNLTSTVASGWLRIAPDVTRAADLGS